MRFALLPALFLSVCPLYAQYDDLLRNPDITWVAEYNTDFELNPVYNNTLEEEYNLLQVIRLENTGMTNGLYPESELSLQMSNLILSALQTGTLSCFADDQLKQLLTPDQVASRLYQLDTLYETDPDTMRVIRSDLTPEGIVLVRARQVLFYDSHAKMFGARLLALAPVTRVTDEEGNYRDPKPLVWFKAPAFSKKEQKKLQAKASYAVQTLMKDNAPLWAELQVKKGKMNLQSWTAFEVEHPSHPLLSYTTFEPLSRADVAKIVSPGMEEEETDTNVPSTPNAILQVEKIRFAQNWYFDRSMKQFLSVVVAVAPLQSVRGPEGEFRYDKPLFYVKY